MMDASLLKAAATLSLPVFFILGCTALFFFFLGGGCLTTFGEWSGVSDFSNVVISLDERDFVDYFYIKKGGKVMLG